jgi:hypothetical protein
VKEKRIGGLDIYVGGDGSTTQQRTLDGSYVIGDFAEENSGKTRLACSLPAPIGFVPLEAKALPTIEKDGDAEGITIIRPRDPAELWVPQRKINSIAGKTEDETNAKRQEYYVKHMRKVEDYTYGLLEDEEIRSVCIDKFNTYCVWVELAINGMQEKFIKVQGQVYKDRKEVNQHIIDFLNELSLSGKVVLLNNASKDDYDFLGPDKKPARKTWDGFKHLGSHCNLVIELESNKYWDPEKNGDKYNWHYGLSVRRSQERPELEGPEGQHILKDELISIPRLMKKVATNFDSDRWM